MFFAGFVGSICTMYLKRISGTLERQSMLVADIDKRVVRVETKLTDLKASNGSAA